MCVHINHGTSPRTCRATPTGVAPFLSTTAAPSAWPQTDHSLEGTAPYRRLAAPRGFRIATAVSLTAHADLRHEACAATDAVSSGLTAWSSPPSNRWVSRRTSAPNIRWDGSWPTDFFRTSAQALVHERTAVRTEVRPLRAARSGTTGDPVAQDRSGRSRIAVCPARPTSTRPRAEESAGVGGVDSSRS